MMYITPEFLKELEDKLPRTSLMVVGDCILDRYFFGEVSRISPEAPVPVFDLKLIKYRLGGAANVAANIKGLLANVCLMGVVGNDDKGEILKVLAERKGINTEAVLSDENRPTIIKTRIIAQSQQLLRIDREEKKELSYELKEAFKKTFLEILPRVKGVILSDYAKGMFLDSEFTKWLIKEAKKSNKEVFIDPKTDDWSKYESATVITPNLKEFKEVLKREGMENFSMEEASQRLIDKYGLKFLVVTLGKEGMFVYHPEEGSLKLPAYAKEVYDVSGAGDTVIASFSTFFCCGAELFQALELANIAAGIVVGKVGTHPVAWEEIKDFVEENMAKEVYHG